MLNLISVGDEVMNLVDALREKHGSDVEVGTLMIVCDVIDREEGTCAIRYQCSDERSWVQLALLMEAAESAEHMNERFLEERDEE